MSDLYRSIGVLKRRRDFLSQQLITRPTNPNWHNDYRIEESEALNCLLDYADSRLFYTRPVRLRLIERLRFWRKKGVTHG